MHSTVPLQPQLLASVLLAIGMSLATSFQAANAQQTLSAKSAGRTLLSYRKGDSTPGASNAPETSPQSRSEKTAAVPPRPNHPATQNIRHEQAFQTTSQDLLVRAQGALEATPPQPATQQTPTRRLSSEFNASNSQQATARPKKSGPPLAFPAGKLLSTAGAGLAIVVGLFLVCMWLLRGGGKAPNGVLPSEAFAVLGRAPLFGRTNAQLLRLGNKLVLVAVSPEGLQPIVEVTDPSEVDRLAGLCHGGRGASSTAEFQQMLRKLANEPAKGFLGREAS